MSIWQFPDIKHIIRIQQEQTTTANVAAYPVPIGDRVAAQEQEAEEREAFQRAVDYLSGKSPKR